MSTYKTNLRAALWCWRNNGGTWILLQTVFTSYFLWKVSYCKLQVNHF